MRRWVFFFLFTILLTKAEAQTGCPLGFQTSTNLIVNPEFEDGFKGFFSEYRHTHSRNWFSGSIYITSNPAAVHNNYRLCLDSNFKNLGKMLIVDGAERREQIVWQQTVNVEKNTDYFFSCFFATLLKPNPAQLNLSINDQQIRKPFDYAYQHCRGSNYSCFWISEEATKATITIRTYTTELLGNDYALDNFQFYACKKNDKTDPQKKEYTSSFVKLQIAGKDSVPLKDWKLMVSYMDSLQMGKMEPDGNGAIQLIVNKKDLYLTVKAKGFFPLNDTIKALATYKDSLQTKIYHLTSIDSGTKFILKDLTFDRSSDVLSASSKKELSKILDLLVDNPEIALEIHGHTDNQGNAYKNYKLSVDRVNSVKDYLIKKGIASNRINGSGYGGTKPIVGFGTEEARRINRRVEFIVVKK